MTFRDERGMTMIELLVAITIFGVISTAFYQVLFSGTDGSRTVRDVVNVSEEARLGFNRMIRDTREAAQITAATATEYTIRVDFNGDGAFTNPAGGDPEIVTFAFAGNAITINGEPLISGVSQIGANPVFQYWSNVLEYDVNNDGVATLAEVTSGGAINPLSFIAGVSYSFNITKGESSTPFFSQAELRNNPR